MFLEFKNRGTYVEVKGYDKGVSDSRLCSGVAESFYHRLEMEESNVSVEGSNIFCGAFSSPAFTVEMIASGLIINAHGILAQRLLRKVCD